MSDDLSSKSDEGIDPNSADPNEVRSFGSLQHYAAYGLFGSPLREFSLDVREPTMLTGANGTGKSTVLRTIDWISHGDWISLLGIPFDRIVLEFERARLEVINRSGSVLSVVLNRPRLTPKNWRYSRHPRHLFPDDVEWNSLSESARQFYLDRILAREWADMESDERARILRMASRHQKDSTPPTWVNQIPQSFPALLVSDQRLAPERRKRPNKRGTGDTVDTVTAIEAAVIHINEEVTRFKSQYGTASQNLDRDFPRRVFAAISSQRTFRAADNIASEFEEVQSLRASLAATGLIDAAEIEESINDLPLENPDSRALISTYLSDTKEKLATFTPLVRRLEPFMDFLRRHYKGKAVRIDEDKGFRIVSEVTGEYISPAHLSSGEQQMFVLAHKLLFGAIPGTLVMIDEPELSLHVLWQSTFVDDLAEISKVSGTYFLLATHSPTLIAGRTDLRRSLDG
ncbi:AAA family ATPase [Streptomyces sp. NBC_00986]|uniref:AAA family ATPase n=1 Tax=Streptomyces sp. NBC_00986 TaxID=2903702 RepID=UPI003864A6E4|nr:ATP-binding protein [Streptomyces sp. NBC_00986]